MTTVEVLLRKLVEHPRRETIVIIVTCVLGLLIVWPVVDEYFVLADNCAQLELSIIEAQQEADSANLLGTTAQRKSEELAALRRQTLAVENVHEFSSRLVELTRKAECQLRRVDLGEVQKRKWSEDDHPLHPQPSTAATKETPYQLRTQRVALSITGPLDRVQSLLGELHALDKLVHTQGIQLRPADEGRREVNLDLELLFFDLKRAKKNAS
jgi:hypothetical protein